MYILDLSKVLMNKFYYDYITSTYGTNPRLLFIDRYMTLTYFIYGIKTKDIHEHFSQCKDIIGLSNYSEKIVKL